MRLRFLFLSLAALLLFVSCHENLPVGIKLDSKLSSYVPPASTLLAGVNMDSLTATTFYKRHQSQLDIRAIDSMSERIGLDPRRDLSSVLVAWQGTAPLILTRGRFTASNIEAHLLQAGAKRSQYRMQAIFLNHSGNDGQWLFFPEKDIAVGGPSDSIRALIDGKNGVIPTALLDRIKKLPKADQLWAVSSQGLPLDRVPMRSDVQSALSNIVAYVSGLNAGVTLDAGVHIHADLDCISAQDASQVHDALRGGIGLARLTTKDDQLAMLKLYDAIQVSLEQQTVHIRADLSPELSEQLMMLIAEIEGRSGQLQPR